MPHSSRLLLLSLAANLALGAALLWFIPLNSQPQSAPTNASPEPTANPTTQESPITPATWTALADGSDLDFANRLRAEEFPPAVFRALVAQRVNARFADQFKVFRPKKRNDYWRSDYGEPEASLTPQERTARRALIKENNEAIKLAMGEDYESLTPYERARQTRDFGAISSDKVAQIKAIKSDYRDLADEIRERTHGTILKEDRAPLRLLEAEERADLVAALTPAELLEYDLRNSPSATTIQRKLPYFNSTEEEYRALVSIQLEFDRQYGTSNLSPEESIRRSEAEKLLDAAFQSALAPERRAEYQLATDPTYQTTNSFTRSFNYEPTVTRQIVVLQRSISQQAEALRSQPALSVTQREASLTALYRTASTQLASVLSPKAYEAFEKSDAGKWLIQLKSPATSPSPPKSP